jgi:Xaa-Pro aminopeptidase
MTATTSPRADRLTASLADRGLDGLLVSEPAGLRYLTGYTGSNGLAVLTGGRRVFATDFRYVEQSAEEVDPSFERLIVSQDLLGAVGQMLGPEVRRLGFDDAHVTVALHRRLAALLGADVELVPAGGLIEDLRRVKDQEELRAIAAATAIADAALESVLAGGLVGRTEREVALQLEFEMRRRGASGPSFDSIVAAGPHGALPHAQPRDVPIPADTLVVIDWGARVDGYCSDCTRTVATGKIGEPMRDVYELVLRAQLTALEAVRAGADGLALDALARDIIDAAGHREHFGHGLGHGVGLEIHEAPTLTFRRNDQTLRAGDVVTVEPGVYLPGEFGVRIEDLVVVGQDGPTVLTAIPKALRTVA